MEFFLDELRQAFYNILTDMTENLSNIKDKLIPDEFKSDERQGVLVSKKPDDFLLKIQFQQSKLLKEIELKNLSDTMMKMQAIVAQANPKTKNLSVESLLESYEKLCEINKTVIDSIKNVNPDSVGIVPYKDRDELVVFSPIRAKSVRIDFRFREGSSGSNLNEYEFIEYAMETWKRLLNLDMQPSPYEYFMIHLAYRILRRSPGGNSLSRRSRYMGVPGFHAHTQTYMSLTDPGPGHLYGTITKKRWMEKGVIVHLEHLERTTLEQLNEPTRDEIESYRIPSIKWFLMTRLHVGDLAPQTLYIGRRLKDSGDFDNDM